MAINAEEVNNFIPLVKPKNKNSALYNLMSCLISENHALLQNYSVKHKIKYEKNSPELSYYLVSSKDTNIPSPFYFKGEKLPCIRFHLRIDKNAYTKANSGLSSAHLSIYYGLENSSQIVVHLYFNWQASFIGYQVKTLLDLDMDKKEVNFSYSNAISVLEECSILFNFLQQLHNEKAKRYVDAIEEAETYEKQLESISLKLHTEAAKKDYCKIAKAYCSSKEKANRLSDYQENTEIAIVKTIVQAIQSGHTSLEESEETSPYVTEEVSKMPAPQATKLIAPQATVVAKKQLQHLKIANKKNDSIYWEKFKNAKKQFNTTWDELIKKNEINLSNINNLSDFIKYEWIKPILEKEVMSLIYNPQLIVHALQAFTCSEHLKNKLMEAVFASTEIVINQNKLLIKETDTQIQRCKDLLKKLLLLTALRGDLEAFKQLFAVLGDTIDLPFCVILLKAIVYYHQDRSVLLNRINISNYLYKNSEFYRQANKFLNSVIEFYNGTGVTLIGATIREKNIEGLRTLLNQNWSPNNIGIIVGGGNNVSILRCAIVFLERNAIELLLKYGVFLNTPKQKFAVIHTTKTQFEKLIDVKLNRKKITSLAEKTKQYTAEIPPNILGFFKTTQSDLELAVYSKKAPLFDLLSQRVDLFQIAKALARHLYFSDRMIGSRNIPSDSTNGIFCITNKSKLENLSNMFVSKQPKQFFQNLIELVFFAPEATEELKLSTKTLLKIFIKKCMGLSKNQLENLVIFFCDQAQKEKEKKLIEQAIVLFNAARLLFIQKGNLNVEEVTRYLWIVTQLSHLHSKKDSIVNTIWFNIGWNVAIASPFYSQLKNNASFQYIANKLKRIPPTTLITSKSPQARRHSFSENVLPKDQGIEIMINIEVMSQKSGILFYSDKLKEQLLSTIKNALPEKKNNDFKKSHIS